MENKSLIFLFAVIVGITTMVSSCDMPDDTLFYSPVATPDTQQLKDETTATPTPIWQFWVWDD